MNLSVLICFLATFIFISVSTQKLLVLLLNIFKEMASNTFELSIIFLKYITEIVSKAWLVG